VCLTIDLLVPTKFRSASLCASSPGEVGSTTAKILNENLQNLGDPHHHRQRKVLRPMHVAYWNRLLESTAGQIMGLLRRDCMTVDEVAGALGLTGNAVRAHLAILERDGLVKQSKARRGASKPSRTYALTAEAELIFSRAYVPVLTELLHVLNQSLDPEKFDTVMRDVGRRLMADRPRPQGDLRHRAEAASELLNDLGGLTRVEERDGGFLIRGYGCPLSAATKRHPEACNAVESLLSEFSGASVAKCCDAEDRLRCCFEIGLSGPRDQ
jgi:predicted ArsR family transcriptional regulator